MMKTGTMVLAALDRHEDEDPSAPEPVRNSGILLEVAGALTARREDGDGAGEGGSISLFSEGKLVVSDTAELDASSANGPGGSMFLDAQEYDIQNPFGFSVDGSAGIGFIEVMDNRELINPDINELDDIARQFVKDTLHLPEANGPTEQFEPWKGGFTRVSLSGNIYLTEDVEASVRCAAIADGTKIDGRGHSLTLTNSSSHNLDVACRVTIGNNVSITGMGDFSFSFRRHPAYEPLTSSYFGAPASLTVGDNFTVRASGDVTIEMTGEYNTYIQFGKGVDIQATGNITIQAENRNGMGSNLFAGDSSELLGKLVQLSPAWDDHESGEFFSTLGVFNFSTDKFFKLVLK